MKSNAAGVYLWMYTLLSALKFGFVDVTELLALDFLDIYIPSRMSHYLILAFVEVHSQDRVYH